MKRNDALIFARAALKDEHNFYAAHEAVKTAFAQWVYDTQPARKVVPRKVGNLLTDYLPCGFCTLPTDPGKPPRRQVKKTPVELLHRWVVKADRVSRFDTGVVKADPEAERYEATDGRVAVRMQADGIKAERYYAENGAVLKRDEITEFPPLDTVMPEMPDSGTVEIDLEYLMATLTDIAKRLAVFGREWAIAIPVSGSFAFVNGSLLRDAIAPLYHAGSNRVQLGAANTTSPIAFADGNGSTSCIMPFKGAAEIPSRWSVYPLAEIYTDDLRSFLEDLEC